MIAWLRLARLVQALEDSDGADGADDAGAGVLGVVASAQSAVLHDRSLHREQSVPAEAWEAQQAAEIVRHATACYLQTIVS